MVHDGPWKHKSRDEDSSETHLPTIELLVTTVCKIGEDMVMMVEAIHMGLGWILNGKILALSMFHGSLRTSPSK